MRLHTVFVTHNRLDLTKRAVASYLETVTVPHTLVIVDNASVDGTKEWILEQKHQCILFNENRYPGYACNSGWEYAPDNATHLHRADNDFVFLPGWCEEVDYQFRHIKKIGQLGMRTNLEEPSSINVGGNCVISMAIWKKGLRYDERPWPQLAKEVGAGWTEDSLMSGQVRDMGFSWARVRRPCIEPISQESLDDPYYQQTWIDRGIHRR